MPCCTAPQLRGDKMQQPSQYAPLGAEEAGAEEPSLEVVDSVDQSVEVGAPADATDSEIGSGAERAKLTFRAAGLLAYSGVVIHRRGRMGALMRRENGRPPPPCLVPAS